MSSNYTSKTAALKTITHDSHIIRVNKLYLNDVEPIDVAHYIKSFQTDIGKLNTFAESVDPANIAYLNKAVTFTEGISSPSIEATGTLSAVNISLSGQLLAGLDSGLEGYGLNAAKLFAEEATINSLNVTAISGLNALTLSRSEEEPILTDNDVLTRLESDERYARLEEDNTFIGNNTFEESVNFKKDVLISGETQANNSINVLNGNIYVSKGSQISFTGDGEISIASGSSGYPIFNGVPSVLSNGVIYNLDALNENIDLSQVTFDGDETLVQSCELWFTTGTTIHDIIWPANIYWTDYEDGTMPPLFSNMKYRISLRHELGDIIATVSRFYPVR